MANIYDLKTKLYNQERIIKQIDNKTEQLFTDKPFRLRAYPIYLLALILSIACQFASGFTEIYMLWNWLSNLSPLTAVCLLSVIVVVIEGSKRWSANEFGINKTLFAFGILLIMQSLSIFISYKGAQALPKEIVPKPVLQIPELVDLGKLEAKHDLAISNKIAEVKAFWMANRKAKEGGGWRLSSHKLVREPFNELLNSQKALEAEKIKALDLARTSNEKLTQKAEQDHKKAIDDYNDKIETDSTIYGYVSLAIELAFLLSFSVMYYFLKRSKDEKEATANDNSNANATLKNPINTSLNANNTNSNVKPQQVSLIANTNRKAPTFKDFNDSKVRSCNHCNTNYEYKRKTSKYCSTACRLAANSVTNKSK